jgi:hypothetical protein
MPVGRDFLSLGIWLPGIGPHLTHEGGRVIEAYKGQVRRALQAMEATLLMVAVDTESA